MSDSEKNRDAAPEAPSPGGRGSAPPSHARLTVPPSPDRSGETTEGPSARERDMAMIVHLTAAAGLLLAGLGLWVGPLIILLWKGSESDFIRSHSMSALISAVVYVLGVAALCGLAVYTLPLLGLGIVAFVLLAMLLTVAELVFSILSAIKAHQGEPPILFG